jgi:hypothetical protein
MRALSGQTVNELRDLVEELARAGSRRTLWPQVLEDVRRIDGQPGQCQDQGPRPQYEWP